MDGRWVCLALFGGVLSGCGSHSPPPFPTYGPPAIPAVVSSDNGFALYIQAADDAEARGGKLKGRVSFTPGDKQALSRATNAAIKLLDKGSAINVSFVFTPHKPLEAPPHQVGWRLIGLSLKGRIEDACRNSQFDQAIGYVLLATKFGFDLTGGEAIDASLGLAIVDDARRAIVESLPQLGAEQLHRLSDGLQKILHGKPDIASTIEHEKANMLLAVDYIQDAYRRNSYDLLLKRLGADVRDAAKHLQQEVKPKDEKERPAYFEGFAKEAEEEARWEMEQAALPAVRRSPAPLWTSAERPWKRWSKQFFQAARPLLGLLDATTARTRLLALNALILAGEKANKSAASSLAEFSPDLILDPYTGGTFVYRAQGLMFKVYSVGDNFRDDGGQTDASFSHPDLMLEGSR